MINDQEVISAQDTVNYLYDQSGKRTEISDKLGKTLYAYDKSKNLTQITRVDQLVTYDNDHNELTRVDQTSQTVGYSYDSYHNQTAIIYPDNTRVDYEYDELQRLSSVTDQNGTTTYTYDPVDNELIETLPSGEITVTTYQLGKVTRKLTTYFDTQLNQLVTLVDQSITYDETGNVLTDTLIKNGVTATTLNTYDERSQLLSSIKTAGTDKVEYNYVIDPFGNKNEVIKYYSNDILTSSNTKSYTYNHLHQLASATIDSVLVNYVYDPYGNLVSEDNGTSQINYSYDLDNNLIAYDDGTSYQFSYDGSGKRISKQVDSIEIRYVNDASKANEQVLTYTVLNTTFKLTYGLKRLYEDDKAYIYDSYGNVIIHDDEEYAYSPYGSLSEGIIDGFNEYGYKGEVHDNQALQYLRARYYHTKLTQFIAIDTYRGNDSNPLSQNRYSFASNNPYKYSDPSGHFIISLEGYKVYIAGSAAQRQASASSSTVPTVDKPLTENQINDIIDSYNPGPSNTNLAWRFLVQEKLQADYLAQQKAIEDAIPKGAKIAHEEFN
ncbi:MAG: RHS repeat-associated core domain-containing protein, partial [Erysipelotrichaceae bacterium]|nr:RHS repeat-associated core domain-containing protein [Erysipelotrichaceae bacterium]